MAWHASTAVEETTKKLDSPDKKWWAKKAAANKTAGRDASDVGTNQLTKNQPAENSQMAEARERTPCTTRKKAKSSAA